MSDPRHPQPDDAPELPSLPDGGLSANMPAWLRRAPSFAVAPPVEPVSAHAALTFDPGSLTRGLELPEWLGELSERVSSAPVETRVAPPPERETVVDDPPVVEPPVVETPEAAPIPAPLVHVEIPQSSEPVVEPPYRTIATVVIVVAAALLFIALWSILG